MERNLYFLLPKQKVSIVQLIFVALAVYQIFWMQPSVVVTPVVLPPVHDTCVLSPDFESIRGRRD